MIALIMAGGFGKRLRPLTDKMPKAMVVVGGRPIIYWQIKWLEKLGVDRFVLLGGYKAEIIMDYVRSIGYAKRFNFSVEKKPLGSAGAIKKAEKLLQGNGSFLIVNGDNITNIDVRRLELKGGELGCMSLIPYRSSKGIIRLAGRMVKSFEEKPLIKEYWFSAGVTLLSAKVLKMLPREGNIDIEIFPKLARSGKLSGVRFGRSYFNSVDSLKDLEEIDKDLKSGKVKFV